MILAGILTMMTQEKQLAINVSFVMKVGELPCPSAKYMIEYIT